MSLSSRSIPVEQRAVVVRLRNESLYIRELLQQRVLQLLPCAVRRLVYRDRSHNDRGKSNLLAQLVLGILPLGRGIHLGLRRYPYVNRTLRMDFTSDRTLCEAFERAELRFEITVANGLGYRGRLFAKLLFEAAPSR